MRWGSAALNVDGSEGDQTGGRCMPKADLEVSRDGRRVYFSNSPYSNWDEQFYPGSIKGWVAKAATSCGRRRWLGSARSR
jgi:hypothetical protein